MKTVARLAAALIVLLFCFPIVTVAQIGSAPEALFGAQGLSLGRSARISPHDALAVSWNPAGITALKKITASASFSHLAFADTRQSSFGFVLPAGRIGHFGVSIFQIRTDVVALDSDFQNIGRYEFTHRHLLFTYGRNFSEAFAVGVNVKFIDQDFAGQSATVENPGVDLGLSYHFQNSQVLLRNLAIGIAIDNFVKPSLKLTRFSEASPREARLMAEKSIALGEGKLTLVSNVGFLEYYFNQNKTRLHGGVEYSYKSTVALRAGLNDSQFSAGAGLQFNGVRLDYARNYLQMAPENSSPATNAVTLTYQF